MSIWEYANRGTVPTGRKQATNTNPLAVIFFLIVLYNRGWIFSDFKSTD
jgi:hypothetical protein